MGKTKDVEVVSVVRLVNKDTITANDGKKRESIRDKGVLATTTTCNVFRLLEKCGIRTHFLAQDSPNSFLAKNCEMIPIEVVMRRTVPEGSSFLKRNPAVLPGRIFKHPTVEFFLKDDERGDPIIIIDPATRDWKIYDARKPISEETCFGSIFPLCFVDEAKQMIKTAKQVFSVLEQAFSLLGVTLEDMKIEFGRNQEGSIILADVIDNDSWRISKDGEELSKQRFRDGNSAETVKTVYEIVAELSEQLPGLADKIKTNQ